MSARHGSKKIHLREPGTTVPVCGLYGETISDKGAQDLLTSLCKRCVAVAVSRCGSLDAFLGIGPYGDGQ